MNPDNLIPFSSWQAWLVGIYFVRKPWGQPLATGFFCHLYIFYAFLLNIVNHILWIDLKVRLVPSTVSVDLSLTKLLLSQAIFIASVAFDIYFRYNMYRLNDQLAQFLQTLTNFKLNPLYNCQLIYWKFHHRSLLILTIARYLTTFTLVCCFFGETQSLKDDQFIPGNRFYHFLIFLIFAAIPQVTSIIFAYDLIVATTFRLLWIFEEACSEVEEYLKCIETQHCNSTAKTQFYSVFIQKFHRISEVSNQYNSVIGPFIFGVVVRSMFCMIHSLAALAINNDGFNLQTCYHLILFLIELSQLVILKLGSHVKTRTQHWRVRLNKAFLFLSSSSSSPITFTIDEGRPLIANHDESIAQQISEKKVAKAEGNHHKNPSSFNSPQPSSSMNNNIDIDDARNLVQYICTFDWKVSAAGLFNVDSQLLCGIVPTIMSYVVILCQLNSSKISDIFP